MSAFLQRLLKSARKYTVTDYVFFKLTLVSLGILLGTYLAKFFIHYILFIWVVFIVSYFWIMYRTFFKHID